MNKNSLKETVVRFKLNNPVATALLGILVTASIIVTVVPPCFAQPKTAPEYQLKAAFLYNLLQFIEWPQQAFKDASSPIIICLYDDTAAGKAFDSYRNENIRGRRLVFKTFEEIKSSLDCHILFVNTQGSKIITSIIANAGSRAILTVGESDGFARMGGIINFFTADNKLRFEINPEAAKKAGLKISSEILKVARIVNGK